MSHSTISRILWGVLSFNLLATTVQGFSLSTPHVCTSPFNSQQGLQGSSRLPQPTRPFQKQQQQHFTLAHSRNVDATKSPQSHSATVSLSLNLMMSSRTTRLQASVRDDGESDSPRKQRRPWIRRLFSSSPHRVWSRFYNAVKQFFANPRVWLQRKLLPVLLAGLLMFQVLPLGPPPAFASTAEPPVATSLRPGMTRNQADQVEAGQITREQVTTEFGKESSTNPLAQPSSSVDKRPLQQQQQVQQSSTEDDYDDYDDYDAYDEDALRVDKAQAKTQARVAQKAQARQKAAASSLKSQSQFATLSRKEAASVTKLKVGLAVAVPTFGGTIVREQIRRRREARYVKKGLEIQKAQYAEYFNITETTEDSDVEDELKGLKNNTTDTEDEDDDKDDDGDDDSDDDDDDDDDEPSAGDRKGRNPKRPKPGDDNGGGNDSGTGGSDPGYGRPSDEDLDRLNQMFKKS